MSRTVNPWTQATAVVDDDAPIVRLESVRKQFGQNEVLKGIDLTVERGEVVVLLGPSGSGKSTLLRCINHLETIDGGRITVDGEIMGYRQRGDVLHELSLSESRVSANRSAWCSNDSTSSRT